MSLSVGSRLGPYEILAPIGEGGMGEVWKARDTRLNRIVALKVSKAAFTERFEHEARAIAALNHPHICQLYDVGPNYLVMEYIEGTPLKGPIPPEKTIEYAGQILDALQAAHKAGLTHRDLKPGNILVTRQGIKLLDFGLAKQNAPLNATDETLSESLTKRGQIVGTLQYMSPEQLQGKPADARSDLFAFGCVLYEMLSGKRAFGGASAASVIAAVLEREPAPLQVTAPLERVVRKCIAKDPDERFQTAHDLKTALLWTLEQPPAARSNSSKHLWWIAAAIALASALGGWAIASYRVRRTEPELRPVRFTIAPPDNTSYLAGKVSPDGRRLALIGVEPSGKQQLWVRGLDSPTAQPLSAAEFFPFWSPDSRFIAFGLNGKLAKIDATGGTPQTVCNTQLVIGGSWNGDGTIIFGDGTTISLVPANGGEAKPLTRLDASRMESAHDFPSFLRDGRHFLYTIHSRKRENSGLYIGSLGSPDTRVRLLADISNAEYSPLDPSSGYLLFARGETLMAQRFIPGSLKLEGEAFPIAEKIARNATNLSASFSVSQNGVLLINSTYSGDELAWFDRTGKRLGMIGERGFHQQPWLSPDDSTVAFDQSNPETFTSDIWLLPVGGGSPSRFTFNGSERPVWSPDGRRLAFELFNSAVYLKTTGGTGNEELLLESAGLQDDGRLPCDWSKDGRFLIYTQLDPKTGFDLWMLPLAGNRKPVRFLQTEFNERCGSLSPDSKWIAYSSDASGRSEIYVQAFSEEVTGSVRKWQVSYDGGTWPKWRRDGKEILYLNAERKLVSVDVKTGETFQPGTPQVLFKTGIFNPDTRFEVTADGRRFLIPTLVKEAATAPATVVLNWTAGIKQ